MRAIKEKCDVCGKEFFGEPINNHGSYNYIRHTNFSNNIGVLFEWTKHLSGTERVKAITKEFFMDGNKRIPVWNAVEFLECFKHYKYEDETLLKMCFDSIQKKIDLMKQFDDKHHVVKTTLEGYNNLLLEVSDNTLEIRYEDGEWFYVSTDECGYEDDEIIKLISRELNEEVLDVIVDITELKVAIICK